MDHSRSLVAPTADPPLERALRDKLARRNDDSGSLGELEPLALRIGLMQGSLKPRFHEPQLLIFAADHGLAVDGLHGALRYTTDELVRRLLAGRLPLAVFARAGDLALTVVDCGVADTLPAHERLLARKIAHGTRNPRVAAAMSVPQAHAAMRAGMEIGDQLRGNLTVCAGLGVGSQESAALLLSRITELPLRALLETGPLMSPEELAHQLAVSQAALARHREVAEPVELLAALGGFEVAVMVGVMLMAASKRQLLMIDGLAACAALAMATRIAPPVLDYCVFSRSREHRGLDLVHKHFRAAVLPDLGLDGLDGTGAVLGWPLVRSAAALLTEVAEGEEAGPTRPGPFDDGDEGFPSTLGY
ncbi:nicotinate-nucleotide--dimethylbenzimidazole phosphoribosyltransferase [Rubrivivax gelatinosus]|uniref:Nicotinate-nucleotide--dimethylbenzimidazole phosphoribosyltransferase n=1 Tax=Rubrivivax gelatinosus (strain NBRC 100245 / IL144) TaxID=983917 RepID=I0HMB1_RUBGI|nr:nicotinate-nucleotide--dimethylbenzimidazole phosphoribosyltransferase [Rubrivivax gelatinosus]MBG6080754.1 nicotinate-nucleotide--dimethylbenzimidazole phosphoribosyltransferase [Rubrivivax gelatinosus]BAL94148.1 nicotinate-nucleotide--dimethylbenzimidazole phosphoribosyltransferase CobT [Rubrivivax gelatinosus IL144]